ncbi:class I SAM-dependent methyltransferase [Peptococcaceae bacterium]|nr:class I SAM-dependent methyltransferase [Peptococcaceae bacterium]
MLDIKKSAVQIAHEFIAAKGVITGIAVDATCGNGNDTLFLAKMLSNSAKLYAFDIQKQAIQKTKALLNQHGLLSDNVEIIKDSHQNIDKYLKSIEVAMFNLGYLPGSDHSITTKPNSTKKALDKTIKLLEVKGRISVVAYIGHEGGTQELFAVEEVLKELDSRFFCVASVKHVNRNAAPITFLIERIAKDESKASV